MAGVVLWDLVGQIVTYHGGSLDFAQEAHSEDVYAR